jgi:Zn-finger nucleic acid-binding protein
MMGTDRLLCPGCSGDLLANQVSGLRQYVCTACGGTVLTIAVLRQLEGSLAEHLWTQAASQGPGGGDARCPFCSRLMQPRTVPAGGAAMCKGCEVVWLDKQAVQSLPDKAAAPGTGPTLASEALKCPQCGAPLANSWDERCKFCGSALHAPTQVVVLPGPGPEEVGLEWGRWHLRR